MTHATTDLASIHATLATEISLSMLNFLKYHRRLSASAGAGMPGVVIGKFDVRDDFIVGTVGKVTGRKNGTLWSEAWRGQVLIAEEPVPDPGGGWLDFKMPIAGRFTLEELARETVTIKARNSCGDTGTLLMNGTTRLELIRQYMRVPSVPVFELDFSRSGNALPYLGSGWSPAEAKFTWTLGDDSIIRFESPTERGTYLLQITYSAFVADFAPIQPLDVFINDTLVANFTENHRAVSFREFRVAHHVFRGRPQSTIRLYHPHAARPDELTGASDSRRIAYCFLKLSLLRLIDEQD
jgi:hypothetical protein